MSINGQILQNVGSGFYADLEGSAHASGANLIIYNLNHAGGSKNQNWRFIPVNAGRNLFVIESVLTGGYANVDSAAAGQVVKHSLTSTPWEVTPVDNFNANFIIKLPNTNLVWSAAGENKATIKIVQASINDQKQQWRATNV